MKHILVKLPDFKDKEHILRVSSHKEQKEKMMLPKTSQEIHQGTLNKAVF